MYNDHRKGYNSELVSKALTLLSFAQLNQNSKLLSNVQYDNEGNIIRDHAKELEVYVADENHHLLPNVELSYFDSFRSYNSLRTERNTTDFKPIVKVRKMPELTDFPKVKQKTSFRAILHSMLATL